MTINHSTDLIFTVNGKAVKHLKFFPYLGSLAIIVGEALDDVHTHIKKAKGPLAVIPSLQEQKYLLRTKIQLFNTHVNSIILYGCGIQIITKQISNSFQAIVK